LGKAAGGRGCQWRDGVLECWGCAFSSIFSSRKLLGEQRLRLGPGARGRRLSAMGVTGQPGGKGWGRRMGRGQHHVTGDSRTILVHRLDRGPACSFGERRIPRTFSPPPGAAGGKYTGRVGPPKAARTWCWGKDMVLERIGYLRGNRDAGPGLGASSLETNTALAAAQAAPGGRGGRAGRFGRRGGGGRILVGTRGGEDLPRTRALIGGKGPS